MKLLLLGGPADGKFVDIMDPRTAGSAVSYAPEDDPLRPELYTIHRYGFRLLRKMAFIGVHSDVKDEEIDLRVQRWMYAQMTGGEQ